MPRGGEEIEIEKPAGRDDVDIVVAPQQLDQGKQHLGVRGAWFNEAHTWPVLQDRTPSFRPL